MANRSPPDLEDAENKFARFFSASKTPASRDIGVIIIADRDAVRDFLRHDHARETLTKRY